MIYINPNSEKIIRASEIHLNELSKLLNARFKTLKNVFSHTLNLFIEKEVIPNIETLLIGNPKDIFKLSKKINLSVEHTEKIGELFDYTTWFVSKTKYRYSAYHLAKNIDINTCVYCNRNYTSTVDKIIRPHFDHYFPKNKYPLLALSFYNLIPSCSICNSGIKGKRNLLLGKHLHPYVDDNILDVKFSYEYDTEMVDWLKVKLKNSENENVNRTLEFFKLEEIYNAHTNELRDLIKIKNSFSNNYLEILSKNVLVGTEIGKEELYQLAFGVFKDDDKLSLRPFSKFKKDILSELDII